MFKSLKFSNLEVSKKSTKVNVSILNQYIEECRSALEYNTKISKCFEKVFIDALQLGRYGKFSESGHKTPWIGYFWSGVALLMKRGLEILGIGLVDTDDKDCVALSAVQTPDTVTLDNLYSNIVEWYVSVLSSKKDQLQKLSRNIVADAFFSKETFVTPMCEKGFDVISRFRNDAVLYYPTTKEKTGRRGRPTLYDGKIDFANIDLTRCEEHNTGKGKLYSLKAYSKALKRMVKLVVWYPKTVLPDGGCISVRIVK